MNVNREAAACNIVRVCACQFHYVVVPGASVGNARERSYKDERERVFDSVRKRTLPVGQNPKSEYRNPKRFGLAFCVLAYLKLFGISDPST
jgi:hypothetical protein